MATVFMCGTDCIYVEGGTGKNGRGGLSDFGFTTSVMDLYPFSNIQITTYVKIIHSVFCVKLICKSPGSVTVCVLLCNVCYYITFLIAISSNISQHIFIKFGFPQWNSAGLELEPPVFNCATPAPRTTWVTSQKSSKRTTTILLKISGTGLWHKPGTVIASSPAFTSLL